jgi:hypothetical protein
LTERGIAVVSIPSIVNNETPPGSFTTMKFLLDDFPTFQLYRRVFVAPKHQILLLAGDISNANIFCFSLKGSNPL